jgi:hypothetical protein
MKRLPFGISPGRRVFYREERVLDTGSIFYPRKKLNFGTMFAFTYTNGTENLHEAY